MARAYSPRGKKMNAYGVLVGKPIGKGPLGRTRSKLDDYIKMEIRKMRYGGMDWTALAKDRDQ
jgi:hypothetical protein